MTCLFDSLGSLIGHQVLYLSYSRRLELELQLPLLAARSADQFSSTVTSLILASGEMQ